MPYIKGANRVKAIAARREKRNNFLLYKMMGIIRIKILIALPKSGCAMTIATGIRCSNGIVVVDKKSISGPLTISLG